MKQVFTREEHETITIYCSRSSNSFPTIYFLSPCLILIDYTMQVNNNNTMQQMCMKLLPNLKLTATGCNLSDWIVKVNHNQEKVTSLY